MRFNTVPDVTDRWSDRRTELLLLSESCRPTA